MVGASGTVYNLEGGWKSANGGASVVVKMFLGSLLHANIAEPITVASTPAPDSDQICFMQVYQNGSQLFPDKGLVKEGDFVKVLQTLRDTKGVPVEVVKADPNTAQQQQQPNYTNQQQQPPQTQGYGQPQANYGQPAPQQPVYPNQQPAPPQQQQWAPYQETKFNPDAPLTPPSNVPFNAAFPQQPNYNQAPQPQPQQQQLPQQQPGLTYGQPAPQVPQNLTQAAPVAGVPNYDDIPF
jgi:hypothetical protein